MLMADVLLGALLILGFIVSFQGLWLVCRAVWPGAVVRSGWILRERPKGAFLVGLVAGFVWILAIALVAQLGPVGQFLAFGVFCVGFLYLSCGVSGLVTVIGEGLASPVDADRPWKATLRGGIALGLVYPLPIVGWFLVIPGSLVLGFGAMVMGWWVKKPVAVKQEAVKEEVLKVVIEPSEGGVP
jgi:hypothetical protein